MFNEIDNEKNHYYSEEDNYEEDNFDGDSTASDKPHYYSQENEDLNSDQSTDFRSDYLGDSYDNQTAEDNYSDSSSELEYFDEPSEEEYFEEKTSEEEYFDEEPQTEKDEEIEYLENLEAENPGIFDTPHFPEYGKDDYEEFEQFTEQTEDFEDETDYFDASRRTSFLDDGAEAEAPVVFVCNDEGEEDVFADNSEETYGQDYTKEAYEAEEYVNETQEEYVEEVQELKKTWAEVYEPQITVENTYVEKNEQILSQPQEEIKEDVRRKYMVSDTGVSSIAKIMVLGVGGGGSNAVNRMIDMGVDTAQFVAINTDRQDLLLSHCAPENRYQIGEKETKGLGAGANPEVGERAAEESRELIEELVNGVDLLFITAGMGGGTGSGAAPVVAKIAKEKGCLTVAVVTKPFFFESAVRIKNAEKAIANLKKYVDTIIIIPNDKLMDALRPDTPIVDAFKYADDTLRQGICGIADIIATPSLINLDFADVRTILKNRGLAHMGVGRAKGENRIIEAVKEAVSSPLLETTIEGAKGVILNVTGGKDLSLAQVTEAARSVKEIIDPSANVIFGMNIKENLQEEVIITIIATGFDTQADAAVNDDNAKAYNNLFTGRPAEPTEDAYKVPRSEPDQLTPPDRQWQRVQPANEPQQVYRPQPMQEQPQQRPQSEQPMRPQQQQPIRPQQQAPYTPHVPTGESNTFNQEQEGYSEEKKGLPLFVTRFFGGKKKN